MATTVPPQSGEAQASLGDVDDGGLHDRDNLVFRGCSHVRANLSGADSQQPAGAKHLANRQEAITHGGPQEIDLEFGRHDFEAGRRPGQRRVATGAVDDAGDRASMDITMLLRKLLREGQRDLNLACIDQFKGRPDCGHQALSLETGRDPRFYFAHGAIVAGRLS